MRQIVTANNIDSLEFTALVDLLHDVYCKEVPETKTTTPVELNILDAQMRFFSNQYAYTAELWGIMVSSVRTLKRAKAQKDFIEIAMDKRDYLEKVMSACKLKYYCCSRLLYYHGRLGGGDD